MVSMRRKMKCTNTLVIWQSLRGRLLFYKDIQLFYKIKQYQVTNRFNQTKEFHMTTSILKESQPRNPQYEVDSNIFYLKKFTEDKAQVEMEFAPIISYKQIDYFTPKLSIQFKSYPLFNNDHNYFTPAFTLQQDKPVPSQLQQYNFRNWQELRIEQLSEDSKSLYIAKPSKSNRYCSACKNYFDDYLVHIKMTYHISAIKASRFSKDIEKLCQLKDPFSKSKPIKKSIAKKNLT